jgi:protease-4
MKNLTTSLEQKIALKKISRWRFLSIILVVFLLFKFFFVADFKFLQQDYVAQIWIKGFISDNYLIQKKITNVIKNPRVKALIVNIDSPGGTFVGGEKIYQLLKKHSKTKPIIALLGNQATSAGYLISLGADYIIANQASLTGSVGVLLQSVEVSDLARKLGIKPLIIKSNVFKAVPHPAQAITDRDQRYLQDLVNQSQEIFLSILAQRRSNIINKEDLLDIAKGKVYIGKKAAEIGLIDQVGGYSEVMLWLKKHQIDTSNIVNINIYQNNKNVFVDLFTNSAFTKLDLFTDYDVKNIFNYKLLSL